MQYHTEDRTMLVLLTENDMGRLSPDARAEVVNCLNTPVDERGEISPSAPLAEDAEYRGIYMSDDVVDLTPSQVREWMEAASEKTKRGLRVFAEQGPVIPLKALTDAGIENYSHFQSRTTVRTRTVTGRKGAYLLTWDDWDEAEEGEGRYAVTRTTFESLRRYFQLQD